MLEFLFNQHRCTHDKINPDLDMEYCPDCGELIENQWFVTRCSCCGVKQISTIKNGKIVPVEKFCHNCGSAEFAVEKLPQITFVDVNYAVVMKKVFCAKDNVRFIQSWAEAKQESEQQKLLTVCR